jgi:hypothetical protein
MEILLRMLHDRAYIPIDSWRARVSQMAQGPEPSEPPESFGSCGSGPPWRLILPSHSLGMFVSSSFGRFVRAKASIITDGVGEILDLLSHGGS